MYYTEKLLCSLKSKTQKKKEIVSLQIIFAVMILKCAALQKLFVIGPFFYNSDIAIAAAAMWNLTNL